MRTEKKIQYKVTEFFFSVLTDFFFSVLIDISKNQWRSTGGKRKIEENTKKYSNVKGVFSKFSGNCIVAPNLCFLS